MLTALVVTCAAALFEGAPFILAGAALARVPLRRSAWVVPYLGCGCGTGPSARSIPAAAAAYAVFGPAVAIARLTAAAVLGAALRPRGRSCRVTPSPLNELALLLPCAGGAACIALFGPALFGSHPPAFVAFGIGAAAAFAAAPCGLGTVALAASVRGTAPAACAGILCIAGIADLRVWIAPRHGDDRAHDALAYALAALACAIVAARHGAGLVHPKIACALGACAFALALLAIAKRKHSAWPLRIAPAIMLAGSVLSAPAPRYHATETTLAGAFAGERVDFIGELVRTGSRAALVRYAVTCCRADAAPIAVRVQNVPRAMRGWVHASGELVRDGNGLALRGTMQSIAAPSDPFVYR